MNTGPADSWKDWDPKGYDADLAESLELLGFYDSTWHNDMCPSFHHDAANLRLWIAEKDLKDREEDIPRFELYRCDDCGNGEELLAVGEKWEDIEKDVERVSK